MPMHVGNNMRYRNRRFGFLYHGTLSSLARRVKIGSDAPDVPDLGASIPMVATDSGWRDNEDEASRIRALYDQDYIEPAAKASRRGEHAHMSSLWGQQKDCLHSA